MRFGRLTVIQHGGLMKDGHSSWICVCDCGAQTKVTFQNLRTGSSQSCGCLRQELITKHGLSSTPIFSTWNEMMRRCYDPKRKCFKDYGAKGISVCESLRSSCAALLCVIGERPSTEHSIDRIENNHGYTCGSFSECLSNGWKMNIRWATRLVQSRNRNFVHRVTINGETKTVPEWSEASGVKYRTIKARMAKGKTGVELILPVNP